MIARALAPASIVVFSRPLVARESTDVSCFVKIFGEVSETIAFYGNWDTKPPSRLFEQRLWNHFWFEPELREVTLTDAASVRG